MRAVADQKVRDPGPWKGGHNGPEAYDNEQFVEPDQNMANFHDGFETKGVTKTSGDFGGVVSQSGPFVPLN